VLLAYRRPIQEIWITYRDRQCGTCCNSGVDLSLDLSVTYHRLLVLISTQVADSVSDKRVDLNTQEGIRKNE
jgi:hypothetical protein